MIAINIAGFLTDFTDGRNRVELDSSPGNVREALNELWQKHVGLRDRVVNERGEIRQHVNIFINNQTIRRQQVLDTALTDGGELTIMPSVSGGSGYRKVWTVRIRKVFLRLWRPGPLGPPNPPANLRRAISA